jgi:hypothetical protein
MRIESSRSLPSTPFALWVGQHLPHRFFGTSPGFSIVTEVADFGRLLLLINAILPGAPLLCLGSGRRRIGQPLQPI